MKDFLPIRREDAVKKIADYFNTQIYENIGIVFEKQKDATAFLKEVKGLLNEEDSDVWNKKQIESKNLVKILTDSSRNRTRILSGYTCEKLFIDSKCYEKYKENILACCVCPQSGLNPDTVENFCVIDTSNLQGEVKEHTEEIIDFINNNREQVTQECLKRPLSKEVIEEIKNDLLCNRNEEILKYVTMIIRSRLTPEQKVMFINNLDKIF